MRTPHSRLFAFAGPIFLLCVHKGLAYLTKALAIEGGSMLGLLCFD